MKEFVILTDACCDLGKDMRESLKVDYIPMIIMDGEKEVAVDLNWGEYSPKQFYDWVREGVYFKTTQITMEAFGEHFRKYAKEGKDILYIATSSSLSGCYNTSKLVRESVLEEYPDAKIVCVDSLRGSLGQGFIIYHAARLRDEGKSIDEIAQWIEENRLKVNQIGTLDDLKYLKRAGRVTGAAAFMCSLFNIKPIIISNEVGMNETIAKLRGRKTALRELVEYAKRHIKNPAEQKIFIVHADCLSDAEMLKEWMLDELKVKDVYINWVGPVIGSTVGPGMIGIYYLGDEITKETPY